MVVKRTFETCGETAAPILLDAAPLARPHPVVCGAVRTWLRQVCVDSRGHGQVSDWVAWIALA
ncbi:hypothetical protein GCM10010220_66330 [Streptomyces parvulus]|nr:hypothetical protein GCM10010220_66330 [Streptomyces parvulus]